MLIASDKGRHIYHREDCPYARRISLDRLRFFQTRKDAEETGYFGGLCCSKLGLLYRKEKKKVQEVCSKLRFTCSFQKGRIYIQTPLEQWILMQPEESESIRIYHQNHSLKIKTPSPIEGFHRQKWRFTSIYDTLLSIYDHNRAYLESPRIPGYVKKKVYSSMGNAHRKHTSRHKQGKRNRKAKAYKKRAETRQVLDLIAALSAKKKDEKEE